MENREGTALWWILIGLWVWIGVRYGFWWALLTAWGSVIGAVILAMFVVYMDSRKGR
jgi:hypothetical protein